MLDVGQLAYAIQIDAVTERGGAQDANAQIIAQHVSAGDAQLYIAVDAHFQPGIGAADNDVATVFLRVNGNHADTDDSVASLVGLDYGGSQQGRGKQKAGGQLSSKA